MKELLGIDHIREVRRKISEEHDHDAEKLIKHYQELEKQTTRKLFKREIKEKEFA
jgi:hypothetical protein